MLLDGCATLPKSLIPLPYALQFDAWGKRLVGNVAATKRSDTGQYLDDSGLLFSNARYDGYAEDAIVPPCATM